MTVIQVERLRQRVLEALGNKQFSIEQLCDAFDGVYSEAQLIRVIDSLVADDLVRQVHPNLYEVTNK